MRKVVAAEVRLEVRPQPTERELAISIDTQQRQGKGRAKAGHAKLQQRDFESPLIEAKVQRCCDHFNLTHKCTSGA